MGVTHDLYMRVYGSPRSAAEASHKIQALVARHGGDCEGKKPEEGTRPYGNETDLKIHVQFGEMSANMPDALYHLIASVAEQYHLEYERMRPSEWYGR